MTTANGQSSLIGVFGDGTDWLPFVGSPSIYASQFFNQQTPEFNSIRRPVRCLLMLSIGLVCPRKKRFTLKIEAELAEADATSITK